MLVTVTHNDSAHSTHPAVPHTVMWDSVQGGSRGCQGGVGLGMQVT